jgi:4-methyl-5(b-hydroxyethyl)-thiazole monophosphate biosynthesis
MQQRALILIHPGFEEMEAVAPIDILVRAGFEVVSASTSGHTVVEGRNGIELRAATLLEAEADALFDLLVLPGGPGVQQLRHEPRIIDCIRRHYAAKRWIGAICAAPLWLQDAGIIDDINYTAHPSAWSELPRAKPAGLVVDTSTITSQGAGTATEFALALVTACCGREKAAQIADAICYQGEF